MQHTAVVGLVAQDTAPVGPSAPMRSGDPFATTSLRNPNSRQTFLPALLVGALEDLIDGFFEDLGDRIRWASTPDPWRAEMSSAARDVFFVHIVGCFAMEVFCVCGEAKKDVNNGISI